MSRFTSLYVLFICLQSYAIIAQTGDSVLIKKATEIVLLKNSEELLPLRNIHTSNIISFSNLNASILQQRIDGYQLSSHYHLDQLDSKSITESQISILQLDSATQSTELFFSNKKPSNHQVILITTEVVLAKLPEYADKSDAIIYISEMDSTSLDIAVQIIFGGRKTNTILSNSINESFQIGNRMNIDTATRLGYTTPEQMNMNADSLNTGIDNIINQALDSAAFPGCQILLAKNGKVFYQKSFGYHTYAKTRQVLNTDLYDLASITKTTAATLSLMKLYDNGQINLDAKFADYWSIFDLSNKKEITLRSVLAHHARLKPWIPYYAVSKKKNGKYKRKTISSDSSKQFQYRLSSTYFMHNDFKEKKIYKLIRKSPLNEAGGYKYSGLAFYLFPQIIKNLSGLEFNDYLNKNFYEPIGANTLGFNAGNTFSKDKIVPTEADDFFRMELLHGTVHDEGAAFMKGISGNAGLFSNANDLAKVWQMLLNDGQYGGERLLKKSTIDEFTKCQYCDEDNKRGLGFDKPLIVYDSIKSSVAKLASSNSYGHTGYTGTLVWADPDNDLLFIFLSNRVHPTRDNRKIYTLNVRPRIHNLVYGLLEK